jgi:superfamily II DNA or RNA helicase
MKITISSNLYVKDMPRDIAARARGELTATNPEYARKECYGKFIGETEQTLTLMYSHGDGSYTLPRGYGYRLLGLGKERGIPAALDDKRLVLPRIELSFNGELRDYQQRALDSMTKFSDGVLVAPCGSDKTAIGMALAAHFRQPALILVHTVDLLRQTAEAARRWLDIDAGIVGDGVFDVRPVTVATVQTARKHPELASMFGCVILDECHHSPAASFMDTVQMFPAAYRYGLTATPKRDDGLGAFMTATIGPILHEITQDELRTANVLVIPRIEFIRTAFQYPYADDWTDMITALTHDTKRNNLIFGVISRLLDDGRRVLALSQRVEHCELFCFAMERFRPGAAALAVGTRRRERMEAIRRITSGNAQILFATQLADEGLDSPILDACETACKNDPVRHEISSEKCPPLRDMRDSPM